MNATAVCAQSLREVRTHLGRDNCYQRSSERLRRGSGEGIVCWWFFSSNLVTLTPCRHTRRSRDRDLMTSFKYNKMDLTPLKGEALQDLYLCLWVLLVKLITTRKRHSKENFLQFLPQVNISRWPPFWHQRNPRLLVSPDHPLYPLLPLGLWPEVQGEVWRQNLFFHFLGFFLSLPLSSSPSSLFSKFQCELH